MTTHDKINHKHFFADFEKIVFLNFITNGFEMENKTVKQVSSRSSFFPPHYVSQERVAAFSRRMPLLVHDLCKQGLVLMSIGAKNAVSFGNSIS